MTTILIYNTIVNWVRDMKNIAFVAIMAILFIAGILVFKAFIEGNTKKEDTRIHKVGSLIIVIIILLIAMFLAGIR